MLLPRSPPLCQLYVPTHTYLILLAMLLASIDGGLRLDCAMIHPRCVTWSLDVALKPLKTSRPITLARPRIPRLYSYPKTSAPRASDEDLPKGHSSKFGIRMVGLRPSSRGSPATGHAETAPHFFRSIFLHAGNDQVILIGSDWWPTATH